MKNKVKIIIITAVFSGILLLCTVIGIVGGAMMHSNQRCTAVKVTLLDSASNRFLSPSDVRRIIRSEIGGCVNKYISDISLQHIEAVLSQTGPLDSHEAYFTPDGTLNIEATQKTPVVKLILDEKMYYADIDGNCFKVENDWATQLLTIKGHPNISDSKWLAHTAGSMDWINGKKDLATRIISISSNEKGKLSMRLDGRDELFQLGDPVDMGTKFARIRRYEESIVPILEEDKKYSEVNVEYKGQVICK